MPRQDPMRRPKTVSPAPWTLDPNNAAKVISIDEHTCKRSTVALCVNPDVGIARAQANAQLIKTAPDLLRMLDSACHALRSYQHGNSSPELASIIADECDIVIAAAKGKTS